MKSKVTILVLIFGLALNFKSHADTFNYPGGVAQFTILKQTDTLPDVKFGLNEPVVMEYPDHWRILVGLGLETLPGDYVAYMKPAIEGAPGQYKKIIVKQQVVISTSVIRNNQPYHLGFHSKGIGRATLVINCTILRRRYYTYQMLSC